MWVHSLSLVNFGNHEDTYISFMPSGVHVFLGPNGAGKSLIAESVWWAVYGRGFRAAQGKWSPDRDSSKVVVEWRDPSLCLTRERSRSVTSLVLDPPVSTHVRRTVDALTAMFGTWRASTACSVFHTVLLSRFALATETERKALMEELLDLRAFDVPYSKASEELLECRARIDLLEREKHAKDVELASLKGKLSEVSSSTRGIAWAESAVKAAEIRLEKLAVVDVPLCNDTPLYEAYKASMGAWQECRSKVISLSDTLNRERGLCVGGSCPMCGQSVVGVFDSHIDALQKELDALSDEEEALHGVAERCQQELSDFRAFSEKRRAAYASYVENRSSFEALLELRRSELFHALNVSARIDSLSLRCREIEFSIKGILRDLETEQQHIRRLEDLKKILGPRGARVVALRKSFEAIGAVGSSILGEIYDDHPGHEKPLLDVEVSDDLRSVGVFASFGGKRRVYASLSSGERAIVDLSLLKALGEVQSGRKLPLPLVYDDVLGPLDTATRERVASFIAREGETRQVLVMDHDPRVLDLFPEACVFDVAGGNTIPV